ncbi:hypothetical protein EVAR_45446_1 [Eumeta japonica]|uniref:Uncharacterized protein n=1 Tax=Eumeta variegata TaxID=151549 RepID=A0A4C1YLH2_EUMVA|nr:hypothetical protein EVAR_45446_1 [Eumeta japonica]
MRVPIHTLDPPISVYGQIRVNKNELSVVVEPYCVATNLAAVRADSGLARPMTSYALTYSCEVTPSAVCFVQ